jgi:hypothetical protein
MLELEADAQGRQDALGCCRLPLARPQKVRLGRRRRRQGCDKGYGEQVFPPSLVGTAHLDGN